MTERRVAHARWIVTALALLALARGVVFGLGYPFFGHMDEIAHIDLVYRYANDEPPSIEDDYYVADTIEMFSFYSSAEFMFAPGPDGPPPLPAEADIPPEVRRQHLETQLEAFGQKSNHEALEAPPYYVFAGWWLRAARAMGASPIGQLFLVRMIGAVMLSLGVVFAYLFARRLAPDRPLLWLGAPALVAVYPQDVFYFVNNDVPSICVFPAALWLAVRLRDRVGSPLEWFTFGVLTGLMFITKAPNMTLAFACFAIIARPTVLTRAHAIAAAGFLVPTGTWHVFLFATSGHLTPSFHKCEVLGITPKPSITEWFDHPIYTAAGFDEFFGKLIDRFWRGEIQWHGELMANGAVDWIVAWSTIFFAAMSLLATMRRRPDRLPDGAAVGTWVAIAVGFAIMVMISIAFDFGPNHYPSREHPFLVTGRVHNGMIVLVGLLLFDGIQRATRGLGARAPAVIIGVFLTMLFVYEVVVTLPVLRSPHNFWNLTL